MLNIFANSDIIPASRILEYVYLINRFHKSNCPFGNSAALKEKKNAVNIQYSRHYLHLKIGCGARI